MFDKLQFILDKSFSAENRFLRRVETPDSTHNKRIPLTEDKIRTLKENYPQIPEEYVSYLKNVGWGDFRQCGYGIYSGPVTLDSIGLQETYPLKEKVIFFGDNFSGDMAGFNLENNYSVVVLWHATGTLHETRLTFRQFIREQMGMGPFGKDLFIH